MGGREESARRLSGCVTSLLTEQPFFGSLALRLALRPDPTRETLASDGRELRYSPGWVARTDADRIRTAVARVVLACALKHHTRRGGRDPERWQRASQCVTHAELRRAGFVLPAGAEAWEEVSVEDAYERLGEESGGENASGEARGGAGEAGSSGSGDEGTAGGEASGSGDGGASEPSGPPGSGDEGKPGGDASGSGDGSGDPGGPSDASGSGEAGASGRDGPAGDGGSPAPPSHDPAGTGEVMDAAARGAGEEEDGASCADTPFDAAAEEQAWDEAMHQAVRLAKAEGSRPGRLEETLRDAHRSRLDWRTLLRQYLVSAARSDYRWSVPNRRFLDAGLYLPSMHCEGIDTLAVLIDTSGSLESGTLATFWAEVRAVAEELRPHTLVVVQVDTRVQDTAVYHAGDLPEALVARGRGGTDFRPGFAWLAREGITPECCLYLTDMECDRYPETPPPYPVLWCSWGREPSARRPAPWGERLDIAT